MASDVQQTDSSVRAQIVFVGSGASVWGGVDAKKSMKKRERGTRNHTHRVKSRFSQNTPKRYPVVSRRMVLGPHSPYKPSRPSFLF